MFYTFSADMFLGCGEPKKADYGGSSLHRQVVGKKNIQSYQVKNESASVPGLFFPHDEYTVEKLYGIRTPAYWLLDGGRCHYSFIAGDRTHLLLRNPTSRGNCFEQDISVFSDQIDVYLQKTYGTATPRRSEKRGLRSFAHTAYIQYENARLPKLVFPRPFSPPITHAACHHG